MIILSFPAVLAVLACITDKPIPESTETDPYPYEAAPTGPGRELSYECPPPPDNAIVLHTGTVLASQVFHSGFHDGEVDYLDHAGWTLDLRAISYVHSESCMDLNDEHRLWQDIVWGPALFQFRFELQLTIPGSSRMDFLGEHGDGGGHLMRPDRGAHTFSFGWHDGSTFRQVDSLPYGWTRSTVCVGEVTPEYTYMTVLFDPSGGPYMTNHHNPWTVPLWLEIVLTGTGLDYGVEPEACGDGSARCRSCFSTGYMDWVREDLFDPRP